MTLDEFISELEQMREEWGGDLEIAAQIPPKSKVWEDSWTQFSFGCLSTDGGTCYIQLTQ